MDLLYLFIASFIVVGGLAIRFHRKYNPPTHDREDDDSPLGI